MGDLNIGICKPNRQLVNSRGRRQQAKLQVEWEPGAQPRHSTLQACALAHTYVEVSKLGVTRSMYLTSPEKQFSQKEGNVDLQHTVISQLQPSSVLDLHQVLGGKKRHQL